MAKEPLPPVILPTVRVERAADEIEACDRTNIVDLNAFRYRRERVSEERQQPPADT